MTTAPQQLDQAGIARRIPHSGSMCLLERLVSWDAQAIHCTTTTHRREDNPLRTASGLLSPNAIEYAAQAMALHGGLIAEEGSEPSAGFWPARAMCALPRSASTRSKANCTCMRSAPRATPARSSTNSR